jgi:polysaccharide pyruvyl transferase WcaK-like protein
VVAPRDVVSAERIAALLRRPVPVFGDFCLTGAATPSWGRRLHVRTGLAINVLRLPGRWGADQGRYEETMAVVVDRLMRSQGGALKTLTVFTTGAQGDAEPAQRVRARLAGRDARLLLPRSLGQLSDMMESSALVVASRLHGAILALNAGALVVGLSPAPKLQNFFSTVGIGDFSFDLDGAARLASVSDIAEHAVALERQRAALSGAPVWACREMIRRQFKAAAATGSASSRGDGQCR